MTCDAYCEGCYYYGATHQTCDYWEKADELRGCPAGKGCTKRITKKEYMKMGAPKSWNKGAGYEMFKTGKTDKEIGEALGVTAATVSYYRKKYWDKCRKVGQTAEPVPVEPEDVETSQPELDEVNQAEPSTDEILEDVPEEVPAEDISTEECEDPEASPQEDEEEADAKVMIRALEIFVANLKGMKAVMTFQILHALWDWETVKDLEQAKMILEYLIELEGGKA